MVYCLLGIIFYYTQSYFLFHPIKKIRTEPFDFKAKFDEVFIPINATDTVHVVKFLPDTKAKGVVIYFHGNAENIGHYASSAKIFTDNGYEVWMEDYPGFGKSTGEITEKNLYEQAMQVARLADNKFSPDSTILYGRSIGTGIAAYVAANVNAKALVLETPYPSIPDLYASYFPFYPMERMAVMKLPVKEWLRDVHEPVIIFHGTDDHVIFYSCAKKIDARDAAKRQVYNNSGRWAQQSFRIFHL